MRGFHALRYSHYIIKFLFVVKPLVGNHVRMQSLHDTAVYAELALVDHLERPTVCHVIILVQKLYDFFWCPSSILTYSDNVALIIFPFFLVHAKPSISSLICLTDFMEGLPPQIGLFFMVTISLSVISPFFHIS